jgi:hypothetical protein
MLEKEQEEDEGHIVGCTQADNDSDNVWRSFELRLKVALYAYFVSWVELVMWPQF